MSCLPIYCRVSRSYRWIVGKRRAGNALKPGVSMSVLLIGIGAAIGLIVLVALVVLLFSSRDEK